MPKADRGVRGSGGYVVVAKRTDSWDTIIGVLVALDEAHPDTEF